LSDFNDLELHRFLKAIFKFIIVLATVLVALGYSYGLIYRHVKYKTKVSDISNLRILVFLAFSFQRGALKLVEFIEDPKYKHIFETEHARLVILLVSIVYFITTVFFIMYNYDSLKIVFNKGVVFLFNIPKYSLLLIIIISFTNINLLGASFSIKFVVVF
jgi:hypothetical protein